MRWNGKRGAKAKKDKPVCFVGKGITFDTGGISLKPSGGMEEMKYDMGGSGVVIGLMKALAGRKARVNAVGVVGLAEEFGEETLPDGAYDGIVARVGAALPPPPSAAAAAAAAARSVCQLPGGKAASQG